MTGDLTARDAIPLLTLKGVGRTYNVGDSETRVLRDVDLEIHEGDFLAILGPSGSGKSTLLNLLALLDRPTVGMYHVNGDDVTGLGERQRDALRSDMFGFVFQASHVMTEESSARNVALGLRIQGLGHREREKRVRPALERVGLIHRTDAPGKNLSGGERQRLALARALATNPKVLFADEPTGNLDVANTKRVIDELRSLNAQGMTVVVITHDPAVAAAARSQVTIVDGVLVQSTEKRASSSWNSHAIKPDVADPTASVPSGRKPGHWQGVVDDVYDALTALTSRTGRTILLIIAFMLGSGGLVLSVGLSQTASAQVSERLARAALDELQVSLSASGSQAYDSSGTTPSDQRNRIEGLDGVVDVGLRYDMASKDLKPSRFQPGLAVHEPTFAGSLLAVDSHYLELNDVVVEPASALSLLDESFGKPVALVGRETAVRWGISAAGPDQKIWVAGQPVPVVGVIESPGRNQLLSDSIVMGIGDFRQPVLTDPMFIVRTVPGFPAPLSEAVPLALDAAHPEYFKVSTVADLRSLRRGVNTDLSVFIGVLSWVLLALACLSSATSMYLTVQTRRSEIALRRAIGTSRASIRRMFVFEGLLVGTGGGLAGGAAGMAALLVFCLQQGWTPVLGLEAVAMGVLAGAVTGVLAAMYPAISASRADPAQAIRG
ncbi:ATP-binding cassette domain-containing protein [Paenarthrobacter sp. NPDC090522]|uniref:ABC transporter ATP-binding protein/permease n=1 Tax=Paenarthrobacter sp. NPDC090522 TaxID=3364383 RepID=UPI00382F3B1F